MVNAKYIVSIPRNEEECILILSALGFDMNDWSFINRIGGARECLNEEIVEKRLLKLPKNNYLENFFLSMRKNLDKFYEGFGFLITPLKKKSLFLNKESPLLFFARGNQEILSMRPAVAIVGSREASIKAMEWTQKLSKFLAGKNILVVSGGAQGIDISAHLGASEGFTIVVHGIPCNLKNDNRHQRIKELDSKRVLSIFPFGPWLEAKKFMFVKRNSYVVSLTDVLVVVEGKEGSGTLHTVNYAICLKKPVFVVPGSIDNPLSFVPNYLLHKGLAKALLDPKEILDYFGKIKKTPKMAAIQESKIKSEQEDSSLPYLLKLLHDNGGALSLDEMINFSSLTLEKIQEQMLEYEISGLVKKRGSQFVLLASNS